MYQPRMFPSINYDKQFMEFFNSYPKRSSTMRKSEAYSIWQQALNAGVSAEEMIAGAKRYKAYCDKEGISGTVFVMQPSNFIIQQEYENEFMTEQEVKETEWEQACRLAREKGLESFKGSPYETKDQFIERVTMTNVVNFK